MANQTGFGSGNQKSKAIFQVLGLLFFTLFVQKSCAREFTIGGSKGWSVPTNNNQDNNQQSYNQWAEKNRFQIGDSIVFVYPAGQDSVLLVSQEDYTNCNVDHPIKKFDDGHTVFTFDKSGAHHFISGNKDNCYKNEKVVVVVLADRSKSNQTNAASPPSPSSEGTNPSPAPSGEESPSPPTGTVEINPTPAPVSEQPPPPSAASSVYMSFLGFIGAFAASSFVLAF